MSTTPPPSNTTPTKNSCSSYITSKVHQNPFGRGNEWGMPAFTPSPYISLQVVTSRPIYTMDVNNSFGKIEKFSGRLSNISLKEFKVIFLIMVCELEFKVWR